MEHKLYVVSVGPGGADSLTHAAENIMKEAGCLLAAKRHLALAGGFARRGGPELLELENARAQIEDRLNRGSVAVAVSGDAGVFSFMPRLRKWFPGRDIVVAPGVSALQSLCAALGETWDDAEIVSAHGSSVPPARIAGLARHNKKTIFFCGPERDPAWLCRVLAERGFDGEAAVGERLSYPDERVTKGKISELLNRTFDPLSVMMVLNPDPLPLLQPRPADAEFLRGPAVPMTREDVRTVIMDRLRLPTDAVLWDIGAGTGSVAIACSKLCPYGEVHAVERQPDAVRLLGANKKKFRAGNVFIHEGSAENLIRSLPRPTHVFVGGSGGGLRQILEHVKELGADNKNERIFAAVSGVTLSTVSTAYEILSGDGFGELDVTQIAISRGKRVGESMILTAQNPVTLLSAWVSQRGTGTEPRGSSRNH